MVASLLIIVFSVLLFLYWFRYTCVLILRAKTTENYADEVATSNRLSFLEIQNRLEGAESTDALNRLHQSLDRDYQLLAYLLRHAAEFQVGGYAVERSMLKVDFCIMKAWYAVMRPISPSQARAALREMSEVVAHFANAVGEHAASRA